MTAAWRKSATLALALFIGVFLSLRVQSHESGIATLTLDIKDSDRPTLSVELDILDLELAVGLDGNNDGTVVWREYQEHAPAIEQFIQDELAFSVDDRSCTLVPLAQSGGVRQGAFPSVVTEFLLDCPRPMTMLTVHNRLLSRVDTSATALLVILGAGSEMSVALPLGTTTIGVSNTGLWASLATYVITGIRHILSGADHLVFLLLLLLPAARDGSLKNQLIPVIGIVTSFTVAHSITLGLSATGYLIPPASTVEIIIAATVVMAAVINAVKPRHQFSWVLAYCFGLVHGFGFASALSDLMLGNSVRIANLAAFNLGVELGQIGFVLLVFPLLYLLRKRAFYSRAVVPSVSIGIALLGSLWVVQRLG